MQVLDRAGLENASCECYAIVKERFDAFLTPPPTAGLVERAFVRGVDAVRPKGWVLADDGLLITLPAGATTIDVGSIE